MRNKLGIFGERKEDISLINNLLQLMEKYKADYTNTFRVLTLGKFDQQAIFQSDEFHLWHEKWEHRRASQKESQEVSQQMMQSSNPAIIPRNHLVEQALQEAVENGDYTAVNELLCVLQNPYAYSKDLEKYTVVPNCATPYVTYCGT
jgi:uncharacterized protein YdiU (UPF0061 family)